MNWLWLRRKLGQTICVVVCLGGLFLVLPRQKFLLGNEKHTLSPAQLSPAQVQKIAQTITVKIRAKEFIGSGTLIERNGQVYTVITNAHVLRSAAPPYEIQTPDGQVYKAVVTKTQQFDNTDLAMLQFRTQDVWYPVATLGDSSVLQINEQVFVGGFILNSSSQEGQDKFVFTKGQVSLLLDKALEGGYQIGYTNDVRKGMSGAPLLNLRGEVVGINGWRKDPVWETPELYQDGSQPSQKLQDIITRSSMAVPTKIANNQHSTS
ncbi:Peptidase S1 and S6 chymotrypsin/Hap [Nostoc sp. DSM 114161]|jgi:S1-C subfamily serine protease|uniref:S1 family peptidase n=1 Tax=Nostoc sp. DSM 114161 TaxID=3440143 RepID=UPI004045D526